MLFIGLSADIEFIMNVTSNNIILVKPKTFLFVYAALVALACLINAPGRATPDTIDMLYQARNISALNTWHSPFATFIYSIFIPVVGAPASALLIQALLLMTWPAALLVKLVNAPKTSFRFAGIMVAAFICIVLIVLAGQITKDTLGIAILSTLVFVCELAVCEEGAPRRIQHGWPYVLLIAYALVRPTNIAVITLFIALTVILSMRFEAFKAFRSVRLFYLVAAMLICNFGVPALLGAQKAHPENTLIAFDLAGISYNLKQNMFAPLGEANSQPSRSPWECYSPKQSDTFFWGECKEYAAIIEKDENKLFSVWVNAVLRHPLSYAVHRAQFATRLFYNDSAANKIIVPPPPMFEYTTNNLSNIGAMPPAMTRDIQLWSPILVFVPFGRIAHFAFTGLLGSPIVWIGLLSAFLAHGFYFLQRNQTVGLALFALSLLGLMNAIVAVVFSPSDDLRYMLPTWFCMVCAIGIELQLLIGDWSRNPGK